MKTLLALTTDTRSWFSAVHTENVVEEPTLLAGAPPPVAEPGVEEGAVVAVVGAELVGVGS